MIANGAVTEDKLADSVAGDGLTGGAGTPLAAEADTVGGGNLLTVIDVNSNGIALDGAADPGLEDVSGLRVKVKADGGIVRDSDGLSIDAAAINAMRIEEYTIQAADVTSKSFTLGATMADTDQISLTVYGGVLQNYATDYTAADSTTVSWNGLGLDGTIEEGDELQVSYPI
jgi:hypothetical protein